MIHGLLISSLMVTEHHGLLFLVYISASALGSGAPWLALYRYCCCLQTLCVYFVLLLGSGVDTAGLLDMYGYL
jgi:hypothetical protein